MAGQAAWCGPPDGALAADVSLCRSPFPFPSPSPSPSNHEGWSWSSFAHVQEVPKQILAHRGQDALRMELDPLQPMLAMTQAHHDPVVRPGRDLQRLRHGVARDDQGVIAG